jgi:transposase-like protein
VSQQGDAFLRQVIHIGDARPLTFREALAAALELGESKRGAARLLGVSDSTVRRWMSGGTQPKQVHQDRLQSVVRAAQSRQKWPSDDALHLSVVTKESRRPERDRTITGRQLRLTQGTLDRVRRTWIVTGSSDEALKTFLSGVQDPWYRAQIARGYNRQLQADNHTSGGGEEDVPPDGFDDFDTSEALETDYGMSIA